MLIASTFVYRGTVIGFSEETVTLTAKKLPLYSYLWICRHCSKEWARLERQAFPCADADSVYEAVTSVCFECGTSVSRVDSMFAGTMGTASRLYHGKRAVACSPPECLVQQHYENLKNNPFVADMNFLHPIDY